MALIQVEYMRRLAPCFISIPINYWLLAWQYSIHTMTRNIWSISRFRIRILELTLVSDMTTLGILARWWNKTWLSNVQEKLNSNSIYRLIRILLYCSCHWFLDRCFIDSLFYVFEQEFIRRCLTYNQAERPDVLTIAQDPYLTYTKKWYEDVNHHNLGREVRVSRLCKWLLSLCRDEEWCSGNFVQL